MTVETTLAMCPATLLSDPMAAGEDDVRAAGEATRAVGFASASVWQHHLAALSGLGLRVGAVEAATQWANGDPEVAASEGRSLMSAAGEHGATKVLAVCLGPAIADMDRARGNLAALADAGASVGVQVCVEFLPWTGVPDLATAWSLVEPLGPGAGIVLDTWHWTRQPGGPAWALLGALPGDRLGYVQLSDARPMAAADLAVEAMTDRLLPGDGVVDFRRLFTVLRSIGAAPYVATEVFNPKLVSEHGAEGAARAMKAAAEQVLVVESESARP